MKTQFLKDLEIAQEAIDKIMAENGKDVEGAKKPLTDKLASAEGERDGLKKQLETANEAMKRFECRRPGQHEGRAGEGAGRCRDTILTSAVHFPP